jgi:hypothetical protein
VVGGGGDGEGGNLEHGAVGGLVVGSFWIGFYFFYSER